MVRRRKHHNNTGRLQIKRGRTEHQMRYLAGVMGVEYGTRRQTTMKYYVRLTNPPAGPRTVEAWSAVKAARQAFPNAQATVEVWTEQMVRAGAEPIQVRPFELKEETDD